MAIAAQEDGAERFAGPELLDRATALGRAIFTQDSDFLVEAALRQANGIFFRGVIYAHQERVTIGQCVTELELIAKVYEPHEIENQVVRLPLT